MSPEYFDKYLERTVKEFASEIQKNEGFKAKKAISIATALYSKRLPKRLQSRDHFLFSIIETTSGSSIGVVWFEKKIVEGLPGAAIYDMGLQALRRRKGLWSELLKITEEKIRGLGLRTIQLEVFSYNTTLIALYKKMGFHSTSLLMKKDLQ